jgi:hypothetical protein
MNTDKMGIFRETKGVYTILKGQIKCCLETAGRNDD